MSKGDLLSHPNLEKCIFCGSRDSEPSKLGEKYKIRKLVMHGHCLLLSRYAQQNGKDDEGVNGFRILDIKRALKLAKSVYCEYCAKSGAATRCQQCGIDFHLPCGLKAGAVSVFKGQYPSYCRDHRPRQIVPVDILSEAQLVNPTCGVCLDTVSVEDDTKALWAPCCRKNWYHRDCLQTMALHMGSLFKCAVCTNKRKFVYWMVKFGIFVPQRNASWESDPSAYEILNERHSRCDEMLCVCPDGPTADRVGTIWEIIICQSCGSRGTHIRCSNLKFSTTDWECPDCELTGPVNTSENLNATVNIGSSDSDISVVSDTKVYVISSDTDSDIEVI